MALAQALPLLLLLQTRAFAAASAAAAAEDDTYPSLVERPQEVCYERVGCFSTAEPWWSLLRPLPAPEDPEKVGTAFFLFTREQPARRRIPIAPAVALRGLDFNATRPTFFITHGFMSDSNTSWMLSTKDALLQKVDANVVLTDWGPGAAGMLSYMTAAANTRVVAAETARLIQALMSQQEMNSENIHLIGHSLGAHISGYVGKRIRTIGKITALDPAQPGFEGYDRTVRLDFKDAIFVEVIHTDAKPTIPLFGLGMMGPYGDVDYYINGGSNQPGCLLPKELPPLRSLTDFLKLPLSVIEKIAGCSHGRSTEVFIEAIRLSNCTFWGHPGNLARNNLGAASRMATSTAHCTLTSCSPLRLHNERLPPRGSFVVPTSGARPFCMAEGEAGGRVGQGAAGALGGVARSLG